MGMLITDWVFGALPILLLAWLARKALRKPLSPRTAIWSVLIATVLGYVIRSFMEGEGGFTARIANMLDGNQLILIIPSGLIALVVALIAANGVAKGKA